MAPIGPTVGVRSGSLDCRVVDPCTGACMRGHGLRPGSAPHRLAVDVEACCAGKRGAAGRCRGTAAAGRENAPAPGSSPSGRRDRPGSRRGARPSGWCQCRRPRYWPKASRRERLATRRAVCSSARDSWASWQIAIFAWLRKRAAQSKLAAVPAAGAHTSARPTEAAKVAGSAFRITTVSARGPRAQYSLQHRRAGCATSIGRCRVGLQAVAFPLWR